MSADHRVADRLTFLRASAEFQTLICCETLSLPGIESSRAYVQGWWGAGNPIPERSAQRILKAADQILKAGKSAQASDEGQL